ncbi:COPII coat Sec23p-Sfb3p heterodimer component [Serendipita sp. 405]|nr:COPII coat Sec23p-Sfb3p heterodimer component [Serendipita sp. 405]
MNRARRPPPINPSTNTNPIQQPPHSSGTPLQGLRTKLDPEQIPSTAIQFAAEEDRWSKESYLTVGNQPVPLSASEYHAIDQGNSTPRFLRPTIYAIPSSSDLQSATHVPLGIHVTPLAQQAPEEAPVPVIDFGEDGPPRCTNSECRSYINPWCTWEGGGLRWICNLCGATNDAPAQYLSSSSTERLELQRGTVDFLVPSAYWALNPPERLIHSFVPVGTEGNAFKHNPPEIKSPNHLGNLVTPRERGTRDPTPMNYVFAFDTSLEAVQGGFLSSACKVLIDLLYGDSQPENQESDGTDQQTAISPYWNPESKLAIITFDRELCFYDFSPGSSQASMMVVSDIDEVFVPMPAISSLFVDPVDGRQLLQQFLVDLPNRYANTVCAQAAMGSSIAASLALLSQTGGKVVIFGTCLPKIGLGMLADRESEKSVYSSENDPTLFQPRENIWKELAEECVDCGVGVSIVLAPSRWSDLGTIGIVPQLTGGDIYFHPKFDPERDYAVLYSQMRRMLDRETGYQATLKLRCTDGLHVKAHYGVCLERSTSEAELGTIDADKSIYISLDYTSALDNLSHLTLDTISSLINQGGSRSPAHSQKLSLSEQKQAFFQTALLYTTTSGERRVRVCNLNLPVVSLAGNVFRYGDYEGVVAAMAKIAMVQMLKRSLREIRESLTAQCAELLLHYRQHCAASSMASQLILPEGFTLLPVYINSILKSRALKGTPVMSDVRNIYRHNISGRSVADLIRGLYPRLYKLHEEPETMGTYIPETGRLEMPTLLRSNYTWMQGHGVYLMDDGDTMFIWMGTDVSEEAWQDLFGVPNAHGLKEIPRRLPDLPNSFSTRVREVIAHLEQQTGIIRRLIIVRQNLDGLEIDFANMLMEDTNNDGMSYLDCKLFCITYLHIPF